ncbi:ethanolamine utilization protein EutH [Bacillus tianshenii]|nr:ethanolamine utilization protein EutH [Bacillus tianshenii]
MSVNEAVVFVMMGFLVIGALDYINGNRFGYGEKFREGVLTMGPLALSMLGIVSLAPVLANVLSPLVVPLYEWLGADPAMFAGSLLAIDMGGYSLAQELARTEEAANFSGIILGTMMGPTLVFTIPVALTMIRKDDQPAFAKGILLGLMTIPIGCFAGGVLAGYSLQMMVQNLVPIVLFALLLGLGLWKLPALMIKGFGLFGKAVEVVIIIGLASIAVETFTGIVVIPGMAPLDEGAVIVGKIAIMLAGAFPMVHFITNVLGGLLKAAGKRVGIDEVSTAGLISSLAHAIPMLVMFAEMEERGKVMNVAFAVSGAFVLGGHLGFTAGVEKALIVPMMVGKITAGTTALWLAAVVTSKTAARKHHATHIVKG